MDVVDEKIAEKIKEDAFSRLMGIKLIEIKPGYARTAMKIGKHAVNFNGVTHGGAIFALADIAFGAASNSRGQVALALNVNISFLKATQIGTTLVATAEEISLTSRTALYRINVLDGENNLIAVAEGIVYRKKDLLLVPGT